MITALLICSDFEKIIFAMCDFHFAALRVAFYLHNTWRAELRYRYFNTLFIEC